MKGVVVVAALALAFGPATARAQARDVTGVVRRSDTGAPVPGVLVKALGTPRRVCTDERGRYTLRQVEGELQLSTLVTGYRTAWFTIGAVADTADLRIDPAPAPAPAPTPLVANARLVFLDGKQLVETAQPSQALEPSAPIIFVDGILLTPDGGPGC
jgi:Carboxypeptidase regulatory-like domain